MKGKMVLSSVSLAVAVVIMALVGALIVGTLLAQSVFSSLTIINTTQIGSDFGSLVTNILAFLGVIGTIIAIVWLVSYIKTLFDKKDGIQNFAGS